MGNRQTVAPQGQPERGIGGGIDDAQPHSLAWPRRQRGRRPGLAAVGQVQRVTDVAGVIAQRTGRRGHGHASPVVHAAHAVAHARHLGVVHAVGQQAGQDPVGCLADAVGPVVEDDHGLAVIAPRLGRVLHDQHPVQAPIQLHPSVRVEEVGPGIGDDELIQVPAAGRDRPLGEPGNAVHVIADGDAMPVDAGWSRQTVLEVDSEELSSGHPQLWPRKRTIEGPGLRRPTSKVDDVGGGEQLDGAIGSDR